MSKGGTQKDFSQDPPKFANGEKVRLQDKRKGSFNTHEDWTADNLKIRKRLCRGDQWEYSLQRVDGTLYDHGEYYLEADLVPESGPPRDEFGVEHRLYNSSDHGDLDAVRQILDDEHGFQIQQEMLDRALMLACPKGHAAVVKLLLERGAYAQAHSYGNSALQLATENGHEDVVRQLLVAGADINEQSESINSAIQIASAKGHEAVVVQLLEAGADINVQSGWYGSALQEASRYGHETVVRQLLKAGADVNAQSDHHYGSALQAASACGHETIVRQLFEAGADVNAQSDEHCGSALQAASRYGHEAVVRQLLKAGADVNAQGGHRYGSALQPASAHGHAAVVRQLLEAGADINAQSEHYGSALQTASACGHEIIVQQLLEAGADLNVQSEHYSGALQTASACGQKAVVRQLLEAGADVNAQSGECYGSALQAASTYGYEAVVRQLLEAGADVNAQSCGRYGSALQAASRYGNEAIVRQLLEAGADVNAQSGHYGSALQAASAKGNETIVRQLHEAGADVNAQSGHYGSALQAASANGYEAIVQLSPSRVKSMFDSSASAKAPISGYGSMRTANLPLATRITQGAESKLHDNVLQEDEQEDTTNRVPYEAWVTDHSLIGQNANERQISDITTALGASPKDSPRHGEDEDELSALDSFIKDPELYYERVNTLSRHVFRCGSRALGEVEQRNGFHYLPLPTVSSPVRQGNRDSAPEELCVLLKRNLAMMSAILEGINILIEEGFCKSMYNLIVVDPERHNVLRALPITVPNLDFLHDLLDEAVSYTTTPSHRSLLMETITDIGATTEQIFNYLGLSKLSVDIQTVDTHYDCILVSRSLSSMCSILFLGLISFARSHLSNTEITHEDLDELRIETVHQSVTVSMAPRRLACLDTFVKRPVWSFNIMPEASHLRNDTTERYYLSIYLADFTDLWGPVRLAYIGQVGNLVAEIQVTGGVIRRNEPQATDPHAQEDEASCHFFNWMHKDIDHKVARESSVAATDRLLIGALDKAKSPDRGNPFIVHHRCSCERGVRYSSQYKPFELGTKASSFELDAKTGQVSTGQYVTVGTGRVWKFTPGITLKDVIVKNWHDLSVEATSVMPHFPNPCYLDYLVVLEISQCTGHARRTSLWSILRNSALRSCVRILLGKEVDDDLRQLLRREDQYYKAQTRPKQHRSFVHVWETLSDKEKVIIKQVMATILGNLRRTGIDEHGGLQAWDVNAWQSIDGRNLDPSWRSLFKDTTESATFAIITDRCIQYKAAGSLTPHSKPRLLTKVCISTDYNRRFNTSRIVALKSSTVDEHHRRVPRLPTDTPSHDRVSAIEEAQKRLPPALPSQLLERQQERRRWMAPQKMVESPEPCFPPDRSMNTHSPVNTQPIRSSRKNCSPSSSGCTSDCQTGASSVSAHSVSEDLWCNVSLRFKNGAGSLKFEPPEHMTKVFNSHSSLNTVPRFDLSASSEAEFISAKWEAHKNSMFHWLHDSRDALEEKVKTTWPLLAFDKSEPLKSSRVDVTEHIRGGDLTENQKVVTVHVR